MILDPDRELAGHLAVSMRKHRQWAAQQRLRLPAEWADLEKIFTLRATEGQPGTSLEDLWTFRESRFMEPKLMTYDEAASVLACSVRQVKRLVSAGDLTPIKLGGLSRLRVADVESLANPITPAKESA